jgi:murein DD-endopeptidase MepM/ murein hydrolase activator NlpD
MFKHISAIPNNDFTKFIAFDEELKPNPLIYLILWFIVMSVTPVHAQSYRINERTRIYTETFSDDSIVLKFDNDFSIPVTIQTTLILENLKSNKSSVFTAIIPPKVSGKTIAVMHKINADSTYKCTYNWRITQGDISKTPNLDFSYSYPFSKNSTFNITQGPKGSYSHKDMYAVDFGMPAGTAVYAARDGIIALVKSDSDKGGPDKKYIEDANFISVYHEDGTLANYFHLRKNGILVKEGQFVRQGEIIGYSGNTGFSNGAHLHFEITQPDLSSDKKKWLAFKWVQPSDILVSAAIINQTPASK